MTGDPAMISALVAAWKSDINALNKHNRTTCGVHIPPDPLCAFCTLERLDAILRASLAAQAEAR